MTRPTPAPRAGGQRRYPVDVGRDLHARLIEIATREGLTRGGMPSPSQAIAWALDRLVVIEHYVKQLIAEQEAK